MKPSPIQARILSVPPRQLRKSKIAKDEEIAGSGVASEYPTHNPRQAINAVAAIDGFAGEVDDAGKS